MIFMQTNSAEETKDLASQLAKRVKAGTVISLKGQLGSGKTTFSQGFAKALGIKRAVKSPTYTIVKQYPLEGTDLVFNHIDAYRLEDGGAESVDLDSFFDEAAITIIEWAEFVLDYMPQDYIEIELSHQTEEQRAIKVNVFGDNEDYQAMITDWSQN